MHVLFLLSLLCLDVEGNFLNCDWVNSLHCDDYEIDLECATDGISYVNRCYFSQAQCLNDDLHILHHGECLPPESSQSPPTGPILDGEQVILDFFCINLSHRDCHVNSTNTDMVCATDGWTYDNYCEYEKARCTHRDLHVANFGPCDDTS